MVLEMALTNPRVDASDARRKGEDAFDLVDAPDDVLMAACARGQHLAFTTLVRRYEARVRTFCGVLLKSQTEARDAAQDTFLKLWAMRARYRGRARFREFLFTIAGNECRGRRRRAWVRDLFTTHTFEPDRTGPSPESSTLEEERRAVVTRALRALPAHFAVPLTLRFVEGLDYLAISRIIGKTESTARSRIFHGLKRLEAMLPEGFDGLS